MPPEGFFGSGGPLGMIGGGPGMGGGGAFGFLSGGNTPQDRGYGIAPAPEFQPYQTPGLQPGDPTGMGSLNLTQPMQGEQYFAQNQGRYSQPGTAQGFFGAMSPMMGQMGPGEQFTGGALGHYGVGNTPQTSNYAAQAYERFDRNRPQYNIDPGLGAYYDQAKARATQDINNQNAASGLLGSTAGADQVTSAVTGLEAERANREADYALNVLGEKRAWEGLGGNMASAADSSSGQQTGNELNWLTGLGGMANSAQGLGMDRFNSGFGAALGLDQFGLNQLNSGMDAAAQAQGLNMGRGQQLFDNQMGMANQQAAIQMAMYEAMLNQDQQLLDAALAMQLGLGAEALGQDRANAEKQKADASWGVGLMGDFLGGIF